MTELVKLAERIEAATRPDRELDAEIAVSSGLYVCEKRDRDRQEWYYRVGGGRHERCALYYGSTGRTLPRYTASIDAAMTLVPEGCLWVMDSYAGPKWSCGLWLPVNNSWLFTAREAPRCSTPALALVAAALRARAKNAS